MNSQIYLYEITYGYNSSKYNELNHIFEKINDIIIKEIDNIIYNII